MEYCPVCGVNYELSLFNEDRCAGKKHPCSSRALQTWKHERVELVSSSFEGKGYHSGDTGKVVDVRRTEPYRPPLELLIIWDSGADDCWIPATDCLGY